MLAFNLSDIITVPFGYLMSWLYDLTSNYGVALILFAVIVKLVLFPISAKIQEKYHENVPPDSPCTGASGEIRQ